MKKKQLLYGLFAILAVVATARSICMYDSDVERNVEALSRDENSSVKGRWKTVACYTDNFSDWRTYCCPNDDYDNCAGRVGTCPRFPYNGCQDTFWSR